MGVFSTKKEIGPDTVIQRNKDVLFNQIDGEVVILSVENGEYYGLNKVGSRIWELLSTPITIKYLTVMLKTEFNVPENVCIDDTLTYLNILLNKKLIEAKLQ